MFVVTVLFEIVAQHTDAFHRAILANAQASLRREAGCHRFDVCFSEDKRRCFLYELYIDRAAFEEHTETVHFKEFNAMTRDMVAGKRLETFLLADKT